MTKTAQALHRGKNRESAGVIGHRLLKDVNVKAELEKYAQRSVQRVERLADEARSEHVQLLANQDILDRAGYKAPSEGEGNRTLIINITGETASRYQLLPTILKNATDESTS